VELIHDSFAYCVPLKPAAIPPKDKMAKQTAWNKTNFFYNIEISFLYLSNHLKKTSCLLEYNSYSEIRNTTSDGFKKLSMNFVKRIFWQTKHLFANQKKEIQQ
jgi:hypothetical protein